VRPENDLLAAGEHRLAVRTVHFKQQKWITHRKSEKTGRHFECINNRQPATRDAVAIA
jgi:hypothetical protein